MENLNQEQNENVTTQQYKDMIKSWVEADEKINSLLKALKDLKDEKKQYENYLIEYMEEHNNISEINIIDGKIESAYFG